MQLCYMSQNQFYFILKLQCSRDFLKVGEEIKLAY